MTETDGEDRSGRFFTDLVRPTPRPYRQRRLDPDPQRAVRTLLGRIGRPQRGLRVVHIAGSKGKGSCALLLETILRAAGYSVGTFTSPHLYRWHERFRIDGRPVDDAALAAAVTALRPAVAAGAAAGDGRAPGFFDAATAAALWLFARAGVDYAILEAGLGGRLDATNVVTPTLCVITAIELEHVDKLGATRAAIAAEKAGIVKPGVALVVGARDPGARAAIERRATLLGAPLTSAGRHFDYALRRRDHRGSRFALRIDARRDVFELPLLGGAAVVNAAVAAVSAERLLGERWTPALLRRAFADATLPGRCELISRAPWRLADGAHTAGSAAALREVIELLPAKRRRWVLSFGLDKDPLPLCRTLLRRGDRVCLTQADSTRSLAPQTLYARLYGRIGGIEFTLDSDPRRALRQSDAALAESDLLCASGSVYLAGLARTLWLEARGSNTMTTAAKNSGNHLA